MAQGLERFVEAQRSTYDQAFAELAAGAKHTHWMWFIFPQIAGLGRSPTARFYAISDAVEASAYLMHEILGARPRECTASHARLGRTQERGSDPRACRRHEVRQLDDIVRRSR